MAKLFGIEILLMILTGLFAATVIPTLLGHPPDGLLFVVGFLMSLSFVGFYAMANLGGQKMRPRVRVIIGIAAYLLAFWGDVALLIGNLTRSLDRPAYLYYFWLAPLLFGLLLTATATLRPRGQSRGEAVAWALYTYAFPMLGVRLFLVRLVAVNQVAELIAVQAGAVYLLLRGLVRIFMPTSAEGNPEAAPLVHRPVPDRIVGLVEGVTRRNARPYATRPDGTCDEDAISLLCLPEDLPGVTAKLKEALRGEPFLVEAGVEAEGKVEVVVRPAPAGQSVQQ
jgi:hypothetical protein